MNDDGVVGTFFFTREKEIEPTYRDITDGAWLDDSPYGVIHRIAGDGSREGDRLISACSGPGTVRHLRIDTHGDNVVMQNLAKKLGFTHCGTIYVEEDDYPRLAYEKISEKSPEAGGHGRTCSFGRD